MKTFVNRIWRTSAAVALCLNSAGTAMPGDSILPEVQAGAHERDRTPLTFPLPPELADAKALWMQRIDRGTPVPVQRTATDPPSAVWVLQDRLPAGHKRLFRLSATDFDHDRDVRVACHDDGKAVTVSVRGKPVLTYHTAVVQPPSGVDPIFRRSGFIHPLTTPGGRVLTEAFPADHLHQHGIFNAWVKTEFDGRPVDFWNQGAGTGTVEHVEVVHFNSGPVFGEFSVRLRHLDLSAEPEPVAALDETWTIRYVIDVLHAGHEDFSPFAMFFDDPADNDGQRIPHVAMDQTFFPMQEGKRYVFEVQMPPGRFWNLTYHWGWRVHPPRIQAAENALKMVMGKPIVDWETEVFGEDPMGSEENKLAAIDMIGDLAPAKRMWKAFKAIKAMDPEISTDSDFYQRFSSNASLAELVEELEASFQDWKDRTRLPRGMPDLKSTRPSST